MSQLQQAGPTEWIMIENGELAGRWKSRKDWLDLNHPDDNPGTAKFQPTDRLATRTVVVSINQKDVPVMQTAQVYIEVTAADYEAPETVTQQPQAIQCPVCDHSVQLTEWDVHVAAHKVEQAAAAENVGDPAAAPTPTPPKDKTK